MSPAAVGTPRIGGSLTIILALAALLVLGSAIAFFSMPGQSSAPPEIGRAHV